MHFGHSLYGRPAKIRRTREEYKHMAILAAGFLLMTLVGACIGALLLALCL